MADYDLAYKKITELTTVTGAPASGDFDIRWDTSSGGPVKVDSTSLVDTIGVSATAVELNRVADVSARVQAMTVSGAVTAGVQSVELNHASVVIAATVAAVVGAHDGMMFVKNTSASGTAAHTVTLTGGTWNGTNTIATLNAPLEAFMVYFDSAGVGTIIENVGGVTFS